MNLINKIKNDLSVYNLKIINPVKTYIYIYI